MARRTLRVLAWGFVTLYFLFIALVLALRYVILPGIENYRPAIEHRVSEGIGQKVSIGHIKAGWSGLYPTFTLHEVVVADADGRPALAFPRVETALSWRSIPGMRLILHRLRIDGPTLRMRRDADARLFIAGIPLLQGGKATGGNGKFPAWALNQRRIRIDDATLVWEDASRDVPALVLEDVNIAMDNDGRRHRFGLTARPPREMAARIDVRGDFRGARIDDPGAWRGQLFAEVEYADLAVWQRWVDYPVALPRGRGAARVWLDFSGGSLNEIAGDVSLHGVNLKLGKDLPALDIDTLSGRLRASFPADGLAVKGRAVALSGAIRVEPVDFNLEWRWQGKGSTMGRVEISHLDLGALAQLAAYLPFDARTRQVLGDYAPRGEVGALSAKWSGNAERLQMYSLKARVRNLGMSAKDYFPGFSGITGRLEARETGGSAVLSSEKSSIDLPAVFPESLIRLDSLDARVNWTINGGALAVVLEQADFTGPEAAGSARGTYHTAESGPGLIDMSAALTRGDARAVWRYMPHAVGAGTRLWLRDSLLSGSASEAHLTLKGDLKDFPFEDKRSGQFLVTVKAQDTVLDYGKAWPRIDGISGDLRFEGKGMSIEARQGRILGAALTNTRIQIPDFDIPTPLLSIKGEVAGPTAEFLKFIEQSPVAGRIDRFTEGMRATGQGRLDLELSIPLDEARIDESNVAGTFRFTDNEVTVDTALPPLRRVNGSLRFSGDALSVPEISASLFGGPLKIRGGSQKDGRVHIAIEGRADVDALRRESSHPALSHLSGTANYRGEIRIDGRHTNFVLESKLTGLSSTLPEPFAKAAGKALPLRFEKRRLAEDREQIGAALGTILEAQIIRRKTPEGFAPERGALVIGRPLRLPGKGLSFGLTAKRLDMDAWSALFDAAPSSQGKESASAWQPDAVNLKADELIAHGVPLNDVDLSAASAQDAWTFRVDSQQAAGTLVWRDIGGGRLVARLDRLAIERSERPSARPDADGGTPARKLPALDVVVDDFSLRQLKLGRLEMRASNDGALWNLDHIAVSNPHGALVGNGSWQQDNSSDRTQLNFEVICGDIGGLLGRLAYSDAVRAGTARLNGKLAWNGAPAEIDYASLDGDLALEAAKGQFLKLDPGAGKLLGLLSLQNLPRRISLDFEDVFSKGLAFDAIAGKLEVQEGIMRTGHFRIDSPSARVLMRGEVDLARETQNLDVMVQPELGETAALGIAVMNPVAGAAAWLASKALHNPLGTVFSFHYRITGTWADPKVEKQGNTEIDAPH
jgi:uncharacterized protein (TIGR02099 family)